MLSNRIVMDVAVLPMLIFNPVILLLLALAVGLLIFAVCRSFKKRKKEQAELERDLKRMRSELEDLEKRDQTP